MALGRERKCEEEEGETKEEGEKTWKKNWARGHRATIPILWPLCWAVVRKNQALKFINLKCKVHH